MANEIKTTNKGVGTAAPAAPWRPTAAWSAMLLDAITPATMAYVKGYARKLLRAGAQVYCDETPRELADAALAETALGLGRWDPARGPLRRFLCGRIRHTLWEQKQRAERFVRLDYIEHDDPEVPLLERALAYDPATPRRLATRTATEVGLTVMRARLADDAAALAYLAARMTGHDRLSEVAAASGLTNAAARAAHMRVVRCVLALPPTLHDELKAMLA